MEGGDVRFKVVSILSVFVLVLAGCGDGGSNEDSSEAEDSKPAEELPDLDPIATRDSSSGGKELEAELYPVERSGKTATVNFLVTNKGDDEFDVKNSFSDGDTSIGDSSSWTTDGVKIIDSNEAKAYLAATDGDGTCLCSRDLTNASIDPDQSMLFSVTFAAPPEDTEEVDVSIPKFGTFNGVAVTSS